MAYPFGGHPTLSAYIAWAVEQECSVQSGYSAGPDGKTYSLTKITAPSGKRVVVVGLKHSDRLEPTKVAYLDRRLGLRSPYFSMPE
jgi:hypothetical protein